MTPIAARSVELGPIPFNLYASEDKRLVLFCRAGLTISPHLKMSLERTDRVFYIGSDDVNAYMEYAYNRIENIVSNPNIRASDKAQIVHGVGRHTVRQLIAEPRSGQVVARSKRVVDSYLDLIFDSPQAASHLFALSAADAYTFSHSINVCTFCLLIGEKLLGKGRKELWQLGMGGLLHDIGKTQVDQKILFKPGRLTEAEMDEMRKHAIFSSEIIKGHGLPEAVRLIGRHHHERADGSGYPDGLEGGDIHTYVRIASVADVYDAITSDRVYHKQVPHVQALAEMMSESVGFDHRVFDALLGVVLRNEKVIERFLTTRSTVVQKDQAR